MSYIDKIRYILYSLESHLLILISLYLIKIFIKAKLRNIE
jgi:hypothetical protein